MMSGVDWDDIFIIFKSEVTCTGVCDGIFIDDRHIVLTGDPCGHIGGSIISEVK